MSGLSLPHRFDFDGDAVAYGVTGEGPPLVLVHGTPFSAQVWHRLVPVLAGAYRVHYYDLLGYGESAKRPGQDVSLGVQNRILALLMGHWGLDRPVVVAHDFGGATALRAHLLDGCDYDRLVLIDAVALNPWGSPLVRHVRDHEAAFAGMPAYMHEAVLTAYLKTALGRPVDDTVLEPHRAPWRGAAGQAAFYRQIAQMDMAYTDAVEPLYPTIRCPVDILWGEADGWIPIETGRRLAEAIPGARFTAVPGAGHLVPEEAPEAIAWAVARGPRAGESVAA